MAYGLGKAYVSYICVAWLPCGHFTAQCPTEIDLSLVREEHKVPLIRLEDYTQTPIIFGCSEISAWLLTDLDSIYINMAVWIRSNIRLNEEDIEGVYIDILSDIWDNEATDNSPN
jgi:hypothetical protein